MLQRALLADTFMEQANEFHEQCKRIRLAAIRALVNEVGGFRASELLEMHRTSLYRALRKGVSAGVIEQDDAHWQRQAQKLNARLRAQGKTTQAINAWWNETFLPDLGGRSPLQAWNAGEHEAVMALVPDPSAIGS